MGIEIAEKSQASQHVKCTEISIWTQTFIQKHSQYLSAPIYGETAVFP